MPRRLATEPSGPRGTWPRDLHRAALRLGLGAALYGASFAIGPQVLWTPSLGLVYWDLLLGWMGMLLGVAAWPRLWTGLRGLRARYPRDGDAALAWRAFLLSATLVIAAAILLPIRYTAFSSGVIWPPSLYVAAFPFLPWVSVPLLVLHAILFGRVANFLDGPSRHLVDAGGLLLFAVAAATTAVILQHPGVSAFLQSWNAGGGVLPIAVLVGYALIATGMTLHATPVRSHPTVEVGPAR